MNDRAAQALTIRPARPDDLPAIRDLYNHHIATGVATFDLEPKSVADREAWFAQFKSGGHHRLFVAVTGSGALGGFACTGPLKPKAAYDSSVEVSVYLQKDQTGKGLGTRLYAALFAALRETRLHRAYAGITRPNAASFALHERFGFRLVGDFKEVGFKFGAYHDVAWLEKDLELDRRPSP